MTYEFEIRNYGTFVIGMIDMNVPTNATVVGATGAPAEMTAEGLAGGLADGKKPSGKTMELFPGKGRVRFNIKVDGIALSLQKEIEHHRIDRLIPNGWRIRGSME